jgi:mRNA interferase RelE/StbE
MPCSLARIMNRGIEGGVLDRRLPTHVAELIRGLHPAIKRKVRVALETLLDEPLTGKALKAELDGLSLRVARFRVIYRIGDEGVIEVVSLAPRTSIYEETLRLLRRGQG